MNKKLKNELCALGADIESGLDICMNLEPLYDKLLGMFLLDNSFCRMTEALKKGDCKGAYDYAHALKGVVLNIGFKHLTEILVVMMGDIKDNNMQQVNKRLVLLTEKYNDTCKVISNYM